MYVAMMEVRNSNELIIASFQLSIIVLNKTLISVSMNFKVRTHFISTPSVTEMAFHVRNFM